MQIVYVASSLHTKAPFFVTKKGARVETGAWRIACAAVSKNLNSI